MKKILMGFLVIDVLTLIASMICISIDLNFFFSFDLFSTSVVALVVSICLFVFQKYNPSKMKVYLFFSGLTVLLSVFSLFIGSLFSTLATSVYCLLLILVLRALDLVLASKNKNVLSILSRVMIWVTGVVMIFAVLLGIKSNTFYDLIEILLIASTLMFAISLFKKNALSQ
jgi:hypothetical protein